MLNNCTLIGRLTRDPELRYTPNGIAVCSFTLAVDRRFGENKEADFIDIITWRGLAENCSKYLKKGNTAAVEGSLQIRSYTDKNGVNRKAAEIVADNVVFLTPKSADQQSQQPQDSSADIPDFSEEDLPF